MEHSKPLQPASEKKEDFNSATILGLKFAAELGYMIAVPAVLLGFGGAYLDKLLHTIPLFIVLGLICAGVISFISVRRKVKEILDATRVPPRQNPPVPPSDQ
ncbi:MAG TPA: AtpZ/AtpI family protein [Candidatus Peribacteraceae bacterium]|nr:AtpZ/AtpI family protein [Candidatus Peribacteraceae bacterium]